MNRRSCNLATKPGTQQRTIERGWYPVGVLPLCSVLCLKPPNGTSRPLRVSSAGLNGLAQSNDGTGKGKGHWCCHGRLLLACMNISTGLSHTTNILFSIAFSAFLKNSNLSTNTSVKNKCKVPSSIQCTTPLLCFVNGMESFHQTKRFWVVKAILKFSVQILTANLLKHLHS